HPDIQIRWYLPHVVRCEREFQMRENGVALLPAVQKIERVLGHNLNITESVIVSQIEQLISKQLGDVGIEVLKLDIDKVDWSRVIDDSVYRLPPFEKGDKEKGFRDLVVLETVLQLVETSPTTPRVCRIALVTDDDLLTTAVQTRTVGRKNVRILKD